MSGIPDIGDVRDFGPYAVGATRGGLGRRSDYNRPETVEETAQLVTAAGGVGIAVAVDHRETDQVEALMQKVDAEQGQLDVLVNDIWGGENLIQWNTPLWSHDLGAGLRMAHLALDTQLITNHWALPLVIRRPGGLVEELRPFGCAAVALTPGWMRSEMMLEAFGVTEANWPEAAAVQPHFAAISESPRFVGRAAAALAADPGLMRRSGGSYSSGGWRASFGFTDVDGSQPDCWRYLVEIQETGLPANAFGYR